MILFFLVTHLCLLCDAYSVKGRISSEGLDFLNEVGKKVAMERIYSLSIPSKTYSSLGSSVIIEGIHITNFEMPRLGYDFRENSIVLQVNGGEIKAKAEVTAEINTFFTTTHNLDLSIYLSSISSEIEMKIDPSNENLTLFVTDCEAEFDDVDLDFSGGFTAYVANFATRMVHPLIKQLVSSQTCHMIKNIISETINPNLAVVSRRIPLGDHLPLTIEYENVETKLVRNTKISISNSSISVRNDLEVTADANVVFAGSSCSAYSSPPFAEFDSSRMISFWASESVFSCLVNNLYSVGQMKFEVDESIPQAAKYLKTTCPESIAEKCVGLMFPEISEKYGDSSAVLKVSMKSAPKMNLTSEKGISISLNPFVQILVNSEKLLELELEVHVSGIPMLEDNKIVGLFTATTNKINPVYSQIGEISSKRFDNLRPVLNAGFNVGLQKLEKGFEIPSIMGVKVADTSVIEIENDHIRGNIDLVFKQ